MLNLFGKKQEPQPTAAYGAPAVPDDGDDRTDPLATAGTPGESTRLLLETECGTLEHVMLAGRTSPANSFLRLSLSDNLLAAHVRNVLMGWPEAATGFRDLLLRDDTALCAAFDAPPASLADWVAGTRPELYLRPLHLLQGCATLAAILAQLHAKAGLVWPRPEAQWIGLNLDQPAQQAPGYGQQQLWFSAWPQLAEGAVRDGASALAGLVRQAWRTYILRCETAGFTALLPELRAWDGKLAAFIDGPAQDYAQLASLLEPPALNLQLSGATDVGRRREHNEDAYLLYQLDQCSASGSRLCLAAVADGMGGHASGEIASSLTLDLLRTQLAQLLIPPRASLCDPSKLPAALKQLLPAIDSALIERARLEPGLNGMGTTLCGLAALSATSTLAAADSPLVTKSVVFWVGDSRAYLLGPCGLQPLSLDHSYVRDLLASGGISPAEAFSHPMKNVITRCLGGNGGESAPEVLDFTPGPGELLLICSDGLSDALREGEIWDTLCGARSSATAELAQALIAAANAAGGPDNITVVFAHCMAP